MESNRTKADQELLRINAKNAVASYWQSEDVTLNRSVRYAARRTSDGAFQKLRELRGLPPFNQKLAEVLASRRRREARIKTLQALGILALYIATTTAATYMFSLVDK